MFHHGKARRPASTMCSLAQRFVAFMLSLLIMVVVIDPIWECHDHLDDLRHLGPHGLLLFLLIVACAGISLIKTFILAQPNLGTKMLGGAPQQRLSAGRMAPCAILASAADSGSAVLPLRI
jgi:hypothetical protein